MSDSEITPISAANAKKAQQAQQMARNELAQVVESEVDLEEFFELDLFNPLAQSQRFKDFDKLKTEVPKGSKEASKANQEGKIFTLEEVEQAANTTQSKNPELVARTLLILRSLISKSNNPDEILERVLGVYPDPSLADESIDFLIDTSDPQSLPHLKKAKERLNATRQREIVAGRNMGIQAREFAEEGLGSPTSLRDLYRNVTGDPREPLALFNELADKFPYEKLASVISFLLHSLGSDLKAKGSSIPRGELKRLIDETRSLQGILGVFRFFLSRMPLIEKLFSQYDLLLPPRLTFEVLAKLLIRLLAERYMSPDKILQTAKLLGISQETAAQIIIYAQMRDGLKQISPRYYRSDQHKEEMSHSFIEALEELEDTLEEEEEFKENEKKKKKKKDPEP